MKSEKIIPEKWKNAAWEELLTKIWDQRPAGQDFVTYTKSDLSPILEKYTKSGQGEIRIFHSGHVRCAAVIKREILEIPVSRSEWLLVKKPPTVDFNIPEETVLCRPKRKLTAGMLATIAVALKRKTTPGETSLLSIARQTGIIEDFYGLGDEGVMFTGGRQSADGCQIIVNHKDLDLSKAQIEIDGGFEWSTKIVLVEMKSSLQQKNFEINQALLPLMKWKNLVPSKQVYSMVVLGKLHKSELVFHAYDLAQDTTVSPIGMFVVKSKKYLIQLNKEIRD